MSRRSKTRVGLKLSLLGLLAAGAAGLFARAGAADWQTASRAPVGLAPDPATHAEAIVQVYAARTWGWRGAFGVHSWIAVKPSDAKHYVVTEVIGWRARRGLPVVVNSDRAPDARWFGNAPELLAEMRGAGVDAVIEKIAAAVETYPYPLDYTMWPGPNSNTFIAHVARQVPELRLELPPTAIGKDFLPDGALVAETPSGTGWQLSLYGLLGVSLAREEGIEVNLLGLSFGLSPSGPALKLPLAGRLGPDKVKREG